MQDFIAHNDEEALRFGGMRDDAEVSIYLDMARALESGLCFYKSNNNVILCPGDEYGFVVGRD